MEMKEKFPFLFYEVEKINFSSISKKFSTAGNIQNAIVIHEPTGPRIVNFCSDDYVIVSNAELFPPLISKIEESHKVQLDVNQNDGSKFYVDIILSDQKLKLEKDQILPRMRVQNSYDGSLKYSYSFGFHRVVCANGMTAPVKGTIRESKTMHTDKARDMVDKTQQALEGFLAQAPKIMTGYNCLVEAKTSRERAEELIMEAKEDLGFPTRLVELAQERMNYEIDKLKMPVNHFLVYNAMNYALYKNTTSEMKIHKRDQMDVKVLDYFLDINS